MFVGRLKTIKNKIEFSYLFIFLPRFLSFGLRFLLLMSSMTFLIFMTFLTYMANMHNLQDLLGLHAKKFSALL